jgi:hypothetical protein
MVLTESTRMRGQPWPCVVVGWTLSACCDMPVTASCARLRCDLATDLVLDPAASASNSLACFLANPTSVGCALRAYAIAMYSASTSLMEPLLSLISSHRALKSLDPSRVCEPYNLHVHQTKWVNTTASIMTTPNHTLKQQGDTRTTRQCRSKKRSSTSASPARQISRAATLPLCNVHPRVQLRARDSVRVCNAMKQIQE